MLVADDTRMSDPTFKDIRRRFGTIPALIWIATLWRFGLLGAGVRGRRPRARYARRRSWGRAMTVAQWVVLAIVGSMWTYWALLMAKGVIGYARAGH